MSQKDPLTFKVRVGDHEGIGVIGESETEIEIGGKKFVFSNEETLHDVQRALNEALLS